MALAQLRAQVDDARTRGDLALATALIELAEAEPVLGHRQTEVRGPLEQAAALLDPLAAPALEGRVLLRLASVKLSEGDFEAVEQLAGRARQRLEPAGDRDRLVEAGSLIARAAIRRKDFAAAQAGLVALSEQLGDAPDTTAGRRAVALLALGWAELAAEQQDWAGAEARLEVLAAGLAETAERDRDDELVEASFACQQLRAAAALAQGDLARACHALRDAVGIARRVGAVEDELEARIALAGALVERGDPVGRDEAERHLQVTRDQAIEHGLDSMHMAALVGQAGLLARNGQTQAALDRCLEIGQAAVRKGDLVRYAAAVGLMSQIYEQRGDLASAYRTFAEAHAALRDRLGDQAKAVFRPQLAAFAARIGTEKFAEIAETVNKAAHARQTFRRRSSEPSKK
jgi:hypothetical protein